jgi:hypothetical protein
MAIGEVKRHESITGKFPAAFTKAGGRIIRSEALVF